ncbi:TRAP transporter small permease [Aestuariirhabdus sp. Z084]|uniref:TRAP transporter small permease n=1 Tax=Aestuariirhabdus haliotis TaxID=2918751 RepID=UPI00201B43E6|nr:TRAP transporter small permease [Aestuariirhabdus haliotis]MCL6415105.1 TRAP transporter small permease [Aestuariirhabdus haliotis]MCL6419037.1 TRAP transporter small permease [Aestuariirhabdus haliotis]
MSLENNTCKKQLWERLLDRLCDLCIVISGVSLVILTIIFGWLVYGRYVLNATPTWVEQVSLLLIMFIAFLGASVGIHKNTHLGVSLFREISPRPVRKTFELISYLTLAGFGLVMMVNSYDLVMFKWGNDIPLLNIPEGIRAIPIMLCGAFTFLFSLGHLVHFFKGVDETSSLVE